MTQELLYTSASRGLKPGSSGFCTVASTRGMAAPLAAALESLSAYRHVFRHGDPQSHRNPVTFSHVKLNAGGRTYSVLSRVADYGQDYSGRTNKLAHHVALQTSECPSGGPAHLLAQSQFMESDWDGEPRILPVGRPAKQTRPPSLGVCRNWQDMTGDAGWAGVLAEAYLNDPQRAVYIVFEPGMDLLPLISEAIGLLPENRRWGVTFSTYFTTLPRSATCQWRCVLAGSKEANESRRFVQALRIDLTETLDRATGGALVDQARTGQRARPTAPPLPQAAASADADDVEYFEVVNRGEADAERPPAANEPGGTYGVSGPSTAPPPPPRRRRDFDTDTHETSGRKTKLAAMAAVLLMMLGTIVGGVVYLQSGKSWPEEETVAKAEGEQAAVEQKESKQDETDKLAMIDNPPANKNKDEDGPASVGGGESEEGKTTNDAKKKDDPENGTEEAGGGKNMTGGGMKPAGTKSAATGNEGDPKKLPEEPPAAPSNVDAPHKKDEGPDYIVLPGRKADTKYQGSEAYIAIDSIEFATDTPKLSLYVPAFSKNWKSKTQGLSATLYEHQPTSNSFEKLATLMLKRMAYNKKQSFKGTIQTLKAFQPLISLQGHSDTTIRQQLYQQLLAAVATHRVANRPDRFEPRKRKRKPRKAELMTKPRWELKRLMRKGVTDF